ncbi:nuclear transport factor 2 family protein [Acidovorax sp.]|uniref:nuclear transport factor 2 family protein n=1 Tax=Acidovorax sp. TaxID=1872122 RepID=UPI002637FDC5|nr:nuclear transport factor 2 family protein [Acidovorax sp.]
MADDNTLTGLVDAYCNVWCEPDPALRRQQLAAIWASNATYTDPTVHAACGDELLAHITKVLARRPGSKVRRTSNVDEHHGCVRFAWHVVQSDGTSLPEGIDFLEVNAKGEIQRVIGFFGPLTRSADP